MKGIIRNINVDDPCFHMRNDESKAKQLYDDIAEVYHAARVNKEKFFNEFLEVPSTLSMLNGIKGKKVLDLGCGTGIYTKIMKRSGAKVYGLDISQSMLDIAKREVKGVEFRIGSAYRLPYKPNTFDLVLSALVIEHLTDTGRAFKEVNRVLKKDGTFIFSLHNPVISATEAYKGRKSEPLRIFINYFDEGMRNQHWNYVRRGNPRVTVSSLHITYQTLIRTILSSGFSIEDYVDSRPIQAGKKADPKAYALTSNMPYFCVFKVRKRFSP